MRRKFELAVKILIGATFFVPLILAPENYIFPFIVPKILWFRSLSLLMLGGYLLLLASNWQGYKARLTLVNMAVSLFFISFTVSTFVGVDWYKSLWDNHERMLGLFTLFHYVIYYFIITSIVKEWYDWKWLLRLFLLAGSAVMVIGLLQKLNPELLLNRGSSRVSATLGNPIYYSGYGLFLLFIGLLLAVKEKIGENILRLRSIRFSGQAEEVFWFLYAVIGCVLGLLGIFCGGTKGTLLGLIAACFALLVGYLLMVKGAKKVRLVLAGLLVLGFVGLGSLFIFRENHTISAIPVLGNLLNSSFNSSTGQTRVMAWQIAVEAWKEKPILGWGPNNYYYAFNKFYKPEFLGHGWGETWFDNAHSAIFNTLAVQGVVGLLLYFALFIVPIHSLWRAWKKNGMDLHIFILGSAFLIGHFVHNAVVFENPTSYLYFFFFLALVNSQSNYKSPVISHTKESGSFPVGLCVIIGVIILLSIYITNINPARANKSTLEILKVSYTNPALGSEYYKKTSAIHSPHIDDIRSDFVRNLIPLLPQYVNAGLSDKATELYQLAYDELKKNLILHPLDIRAHLQFAQLVQQGVSVLKEPPQSLAEAETVLKDALTKSPKRQQVIYQLSVIELLMGKQNEAAAVLWAAIVDDASLGEGWWRLALVYSQFGDNDKAMAIIKTARNEGVQFDARGEDVIVTIFQAGGDSK